MNSFISVSSLVVVFSLVIDANGWVFTDVDFDKLMEMQGKSLFEDEESGVSPSGEMDVAQLKLSLIYPGTKWCGPGNVASDYDDLGSQRETDMCCRDHDNCPDLLAAGETKYNLTNNAYYTRLSCECDEKFRSCLHSANSSTANHIGTIYFNAIATKCFNQDYPIVGCKRRGGWFYRKCLKYTFDENSEKRFQWFDVPNY